MDTELLFTINKGLFLLFLAVGGNYVAQTFSCKTQKLLLENMYAKQLIVLFIIYFAIGFVDESNTSPFQKVLLALLIWILFLMFTKMNLVFTIISFSLFSFAYFIQTWIMYYKNMKDDKKYGEEISNLEHIFRNLVMITIFIIIIGFIMYYTEQYNDKQKDFSLLKFIFGTVKCDSLK